MAVQIIIATLIFLIFYCLLKYIIVPSLSSKMVEEEPLSDLDILVRESEEIAEKKEIVKQKATTSAKKVKTIKDNLEKK